MSKSLDPRRSFTRWERIRYSTPVVYAEALWTLIYRRYDDAITPRPVWETERPDVPRETKED